MFIKRIFFSIPTLWFAASAAATTVSSVSVADDWFAANANYTSFTLSGNPSDAFLRTFGTTDFNRSALEFSLANIVPGAVIQSASFSVQSRGTAVSGGLFNIYGYSGDGVVTVADATQTATLIGSTPTQAGTPLYTIDATALIRSLVGTNASFAGFLITVSPQDQFFGNDLCSRESSAFVNEFCTAADLPTLTVNYSAAATVPEPGTVALFGIAISGLASVRRRRRDK